MISLDHQAPEQLHSHECNRQNKGTRRRSIPQQPELIKQRKHEQKRKTKPLMILLRTTQRSKLTSRPPKNEQTWWRKDSVLNANNPDIKQTIPCSTPNKNLDSTVGQKGKGRLLPGCLTRGFLIRRAESTSVYPYINIYSVTTATISSNKLSIPIWIEKDTERKTVKP